MPGRRTRGTADTAADASPHGFAGPPRSTLRRPPPLDVPLPVELQANGDAHLLHNGDLVGTASPRAVETRAMESPGFERACEASSRSFAAKHHPQPACFVCGPDRAIGDGLRIHPGPVEFDDVEWRGLVAAPWTPGDDLADDDGLVCAEFLWAALDCPTAYASSSPAGMPYILLGRQATAVHRRPTAGVPLVVTAIRTGRDGRKYFADSALFDDSGDLLAESSTVWIEVSRRGRARYPWLTCQLHCQTPA